MAAPTTRTALTRHARGLLGPRPPDSRRLSSVQQLTHRSHTDARLPEGDRRADRHARDGLLRDVRRDRDHRDAPVPDLALLERVELLGALLGDAEGAIVAREPVVAVGLLDAEVLRLDERDEEEEGDDRARDRALLEAAVEDRRRLAARLDKEVGPGGARRR